jgi:O-antigen ligase
MTPTADTAEAGWAGATNSALTRPAPNPLVTLGFLSFCFYVFSFDSHILDLGPARLHLPGIAFGFAIVMAVLSGRIIEVLQDRIAVYLVGLTFWLVIAIPGSFWRGGSFTVLTGAWIPAMLLFLVGGAVIATLEQCRRALCVIGLGTAAGALLVHLSGQTVHERLMVANSTFANSNTIAIKLLLGMPMVWLLAAGARAGTFRKIFVGGVLILMFAALFRTGSREGLIGLASLFVAAFVRSPMAGKIRLAIAVLAILAGAVLFLPRSVKSRFATTFQGAAVDMQDAQTLEDRKMLISAGGSSSARWGLLLTSLRLTLQHPLLGVGPGQFAPYLASQAKAKGMSTGWVGTHNTYTQLSSEVGIPALCLYVATLMSSMRALGRIYRRAKRIPGKQAHDVATTALALHASFLAYCVCCLFNHMAYEMTMPLMAGITVAIRRTAPDELNRLEDAEGRQTIAPESFLPILRNRSGAIAG